MFDVRRSRRPLPCVLLLVTLALLLPGGMVAGPALAAAPVVQLLAQGGRGTSFHMPVDAAPSPDGTIVFFVARTASGEAALFRVPSHGGTVTRVLAGAPLVDPRGLVVAADGQTLYIADPGVAGGGAVLAVALGGGAVHVVAGTVGKRPRALDLVPGMLYVAGIDHATHRAQAWRLDLHTAAAPEPLILGSPLATADGIAARADGELLVAGHTSPSIATGVVLRVRHGVHRPLVTGVILGNPAGIALTHDQTTLLVSALSAVGTSQVLIVDLATGSTSTFNDVIGANDASGGLHRALQTNLFGWCGTGRGGRVYRVQL